MSTACIQCYHFKWIINSCTGSACVVQCICATCAPVSGTLLHVHYYMCVSREDRVTCACHEGTGLHVRVTRGQGGLLQITQFSRAYNTGSSERGESPGVHSGGPGWLKLMMIAFNRIVAVLFVLLVGGGKCCALTVGSTAEGSRQLAVRAFSR